ncbi:hypothetical protein [Roseofilum casamattae]|uniref:Chromosomal replication initiator DnaA C-terminal domain-containing protein n=1 Tax=Roseofilum casamattae BLCC-M143 TaxID=3022442 RepID=A0ABT7BTI7_9CYAN|nr:hypothetical protein [Roseofilum casamattae]MDJ1182501.1 hypothetical protein [Roseofilum casamattae BLCC-M143]
MSNASPYWLWIRINAFGTCHSVEDQTARDFVGEQFTALLYQAPLPHAKIQQELQQSKEAAAQAGSPAERCLRCFISHQIKQICLDLEQRFGATHDFTHRELLPFVLSDSPHPVAHPTHHSLGDRILETFDSSKSTLSAWSTRLFKSDRMVKRFLLDRGMEQVTDWLILNRTNIGRLTQILEQHQATATEIEQACELLQCYHQVYRTELLAQRSKSTKRRFPEPTEEQLEAIAKPLNLSPERAMQQLKYLAGLMRVARIQARGGILPPSMPLPRVESAPPEDSSEELDFLDRYREEFQYCLNEAIAKAIQTRLQSYATGKTPRAKEKGKHKQTQFLRALYLFHCQGASMSDIARELDIGDQPRVSRLLNLKALRADISRWTTHQLSDRVLKLARGYADTDYLERVAANVREILDREVNSAMAEAIREASCNQRPHVPSQLTQSICHYLETQHGPL